MENVFVASECRTIQSIREYTFVIMSFANDAIIFQFMPYNASDIDTVFCFNTVLYNKDGLNAYSIDAPDVCIQSLPE
jgi:hypothetical protein